LIVCVSEARVSYMPVKTGIGYVRGTWHAISDSILRFPCCTQPYRSNDHLFFGIARWFPPGDSSTNESRAAFRCCFSRSGACLLASAVATRFLARDLHISLYTYEYLFSCAQWCPVTDNRLTPSRCGHDVSRCTAGMRDQQN
jgi:hypothetical protein